MALFQIKHKFSGSALFELECGSLKIAVETAVKSGAYLRGADLGSADLGSADLRGADLRGAYLRGRKVNGDIGLIEAGTPNCWFALGFVDAETGELCVSVGCQLKEIGDGRAYWSSEKHHDRENRREVLAALDYIEAVARLRGWTGEARAKAEAA